MRQGERLTVEEAVEGGEEAGVGDRDAGGVADDAGAGGAEGGDGEGHGDAVVAGRVDLGAVKRRSGGRDACGRAAGDAQAVGELFNAGAHAAEVFGQGGKAVTFLDAQFLSVADFNSLVCVRGEGCEHGQLVDHLRDLWAGDNSTLQLRMADGDVADELAVCAADGDEADDGTHRGEEVENGGAGGVETD